MQYSKTLPSSHPAFPGCLAFLCLAVLLATGACRATQRDYAVFQFVAGEVYILRDGQDDQKRRAHIGATAGPADVIETRADSAAELEVREMGLIRMGENSRLKLGDLNSSKHLNIQLENGKAGFLMKKLNRGQEFRVNTPTVVASVRGTRFLVGVYSSQTADEKPQAGGVEYAKVAMFDGALELQSSGVDPKSADESANSTLLDQPGEVRLKPGDTLSADSIQPLSAESIAEMKALEEMTSPGGRAKPNAGMLPSAIRNIAPRATPLPLPQK